MSEAPKKILYHKKKHVFGWETEETISYIRADIVDELVEAAEVLLRSLDWDSEVKEKNWWFEARAKARAALAKLEESHE